MCVCMYVCVKSRMRSIARRERRGGGEGVVNMPLVEQRMTELRGLLC